MPQPVNLKVLGHAMSYALRHEPAAHGLVLDTEGWPADAVPGRFLCALGEATG